MIDLQPGDVGGVKTHDAYGLAIAACQWLAGYSQWRIGHVFTITEVDATGKVMIVEETPRHGCREVELHYKKFTVSRPKGDPAKAVDRVRWWIGTRYGFRAIPALLLSILGVRPKWVRTEIMSDRTAVCSQVCGDGVYAEGDPRIPTVTGAFYQTPASLVSILGVLYDAEL